MKRRLQSRVMTVVCGLVMFTFAYAAGASAGQITNDATIVGQVLDEGAGVLPGVTVTATSPALQMPSVTTVTDARGEYRLTPLPIGTYTIEYTLPGFTTIRQEGVRLTSGFTAKLDVVLKVGGVEQLVTVTGGSPQVDVAATNTVTQLTKEALESIPTGRNGYIGLMQMTPGARPPLDVGGNTNNANPTFVAFGQTGQAWQAIDGVATKNPRVSDSGNYFDFTAFQEASIATLGHDASIPSRGVVINAVIATGSNQFHGKAFYGFTSSQFQSGGAEAGGVDVKIRDDVQGDIGGRLVRDRVWFWVGARSQRNRADSLDCEQPDGSPCRETQDSHFLTTKWTAQLTGSQRLTAFYMLMRGGGEEGFNSLINWESRRVQPLQPSVFKVEWQGIKGNSLVMSANWGGWKGHSGSVCPDGSKSLSASGVDLSSCRGIATTDAVTGVVTGLNTRAGERLLESRWQARTNVSYYKPDLFLGHHELKVGFDAFFAPQNRHQVGRGAAGNYQLTFRSGVADRIALWNYPVHPDLSLRYYGTYIADSWTIGRKLTLNLGIRHAYDKGFENPTCREVADGPSGTIYPAGCFPAVHMPVFNTFAPRLRAAYDVTGDGRTVLKGGWGRYYSQRTADQVQLVARNVLDTTTFRWRDLNGNRDYDTGEVNLDVNGADFISRSSGGLVGALQGGINNPDERTPHTDEYSVQFERQLTSTLALRVTGVESRVGDAQRVANVLRPYEVYNIPITNPDPGPDNRTGTADDPGQSITYYDYPASLAGLAFQRVMLVNDSRADEQYHSVETAVSKRLSDRWQFMLSYTATKKNIPLQANAGTFNTQDPNAEINSADTTWDWMTRASGSFLFAHGIQVAANFESRSGVPLARTVAFANGARVGTLTLRVEPIGSIQLPTINMLNIRGEKAFAIGSGREALLRLNLYNTLNTNVATAMTVQSGTNFGVVTARVLPRIADLQMQFKF